MAFRDDLYTQDILDRVDDLKSRQGHRPVNKYDLDILNYRLKSSLEDDLGIIVETDGRIRNYAEDVPRIFVMAKGADGSDTMMDLASAGLERDSMEFWKQVQLGNVFAYPAGDTYPVQLQVDTKGMNPKIAFSKPVTADKLPAPLEPKRPGFFTRFGALFSRRLREQCQTYDNWESDKRINFNRMNMNASKRGEALDTEKKDIKRLLDRKAEKLRDDANKEVRDNILKREKNGMSKEKGLNNAISMYKPVPEVRKNLLTKEDDRKSKFYTQEQFNKLEPYKDLDLSKIKIGGKALDDKDFTALSIAASMQTKYALKNPLLVHGGGGKDTLVFQEQLGISKEDAEYMDAAAFDSVLCKDLMDAGGERANNGQAIEDMAVPGRRDVKNALMKYDPNDPESKRDLAKIIAFGVKRAGKSLSVQSGKLQERVHNYFHMCGKLTELADRDPDLKKLALEEGMDLECYKAVKGMAELDRLDTERTAAKKTLYTAAVGDKPLDAETKRKAIRNILKAELAETTIVGEAAQTKDDPKVLENYNKLKAKEFNAPMPNDFKTNQEYLDAMAQHSKIVTEGKARGDVYAPGGKLWAGKPAVMLNSMRELYNPVPKSAQSLGSSEAQDQLDRMVDEIIEKDKLMSYGTSVLGEKLQSSEYTGNSLIKKGELAAESLKQKEAAPLQQAPAVQNAPAAAEEEKEKKEQIVQTV